MFFEVLLRHNIQFDYRNPSHYVYFFVLLWIGWVVIMAEFPLPPQGTPGMVLCKLITLGIWLGIAFSGLGVIVDYTLRHLGR